MHLSTNLVMNAMHASQSTRAPGRMPARRSASAACSRCLGADINRPRDQLCVRRWEWIMTTPCLDMTTNGRHGRRRGASIEDMASRFHQLVLFGYLQSVSCLVAAHRVAILKDIARHLTSTIACCPQFAPVKPVAAADTCFDSSEKPSSEAPVPTPSVLDHDRMWTRRILAC